ncbi:hypothetical protein [Lentzea terrae]|jgi:hypothetical protein|uniref:hypothetical protein n=1 Tax=Lentzea terrae TaxID=2200761 RepID=UPI000DD401C0|nr:hypothetical protein [Lentzea terrae]
MKILGLLVTAVLVLLPAPAHAAIQGSTNGVCGPIPSQSDCSIATDQFPGGRLSVDADLVRSWPFGNYRASWEVWDSQGPTGCKREIWSDDPAGSWTCEGVHAGYVSVSINKMSPDFAHLGLRW